MPRLKEGEMEMLRGKVALVTGGSRGIGAAIAKKLAGEGACVLITYVSRERQAQEVVSAIDLSGGEAVALRVDVTEKAQVVSAVRAAVRTFGRIDVLVNNAGIWKRGEMGKMTERQWDETIAVNLKGTFLFCNYVVPIMKKQRGGKIINIASTAGQRGEPFYSHYAASKGGVIAFTKAIAVELAPHNIIVNCIAPGWVDTDMAAVALRNLRVRKEIRREIPRGRVAQPEEIAGAVLFLASPSSDHLVGSTISINGGSVLV
jgi:3-oxoacyl-[acyl-carrier protein] reductase